jgi:hypothetical protein
VHHNDIHPRNFATEICRDGVERGYLFDFGAASCSALQVSEAVPFVVLQGSAAETQRQIQHGMIVCSRHHCVQLCCRSTASYSASQMT